MVVLTYQLCLEILKITIIPSEGFKASCQANYINI